MNAFSLAFARLLARTRRPRTIRVIDEAPLFGGSAVHVVDVDGRRVVFATAQSAICLLTLYDAAAAPLAREEAAPPIADISR